MFLNYIRDRFSLDEIKLDDLGGLRKEVFEDYLEYLEHYESDHGEVTNGRRSLARKLSALKSFFKYLFTNELISTFEISKVENPKVPKKEIICMDKSEVSDFLSAVHGNAQMTKKQRQYHDLQEVRDLALVYLLLTAGIRASECSELDVDDIDMNRSCIYITRKGGNEATVYFSDQASPYLADYIDWRLHNDKIPETEKALFLSSRKTRLAVRSIEVIIKKYAVASLPGKGSKITPHKLRATFATQLYESTGDIYLVAESLGHNDISTTKNHYARLSNKRKEANRNAITFEDRKDDT